MQKIRPTFWPYENDADRRLTQAHVSKDNTKDYQNKQNIFTQGEVADSVFFIQKGRIKLTVTSEQGKEAVVAILDEGQFFGEGCLQDEAVRTATATALGDCRITLITKSALLAAVRDQPEFCKLFINHLLSRNSRIQEDVVDQLFNSSEKRLARLLLLLANYGKEGNPPIVPVILNQETLAEMIGTTRSRVSFFLNRFRELGFIDYNSDGMNVNSSLVSVVLHD